jgi:hypothetical protein
MATDVGKVDGVKRVSAETRVPTALRNQNNCICRAVDETA